MEATPYHVPYVDGFSAFDYCDVLVFDEGALRGLVCWHGVKAVPRCIGCEAYPS